MTIAKKVEEQFLEKVTEALKGDHNDLRKEQIILNAYRESLREHGESEYKRGEKNTKDKVREMVVGELRDVDCGHESYLDGLAAGCPEEHRQEIIMKVLGAVDYPGKYIQEALEEATTDMHEPSVWDDFDSGCSRIEKPKA